jgi:hypothetical protein
MSKRRLSEAMAVRSPLTRREPAEPAETPTERAPGRRTAESPVTEDAAPDRPDASDSAGGTVANRGGRDDEVVVLVAARSAQPRDSTVPVPPTRGTPGTPSGQGQGQAALERWLDAQRELSDAWFGLAEQTLPVLSPGLPVGWGHTVLRAWRDTTRQLLAAQAAWLRCWAPRSPTR